MARTVNVGPSTMAILVPSARTHSLGRVSSVADEVETAVADTGYSVGARDEERLVYLARFAELAPTWSRWSKEAGRRPGFRILPASPSQAGCVDVMAPDMTDITAEAERRELVLGCGAALLHLRLALEAFGEHFTVEEFPDGPDASRVARVALDGRAEPSAIALRTLSSGLRRGPAKEPFANAMVPAASVKAIANECRRERVLFRVIVGDERDAVAQVVSEHGSKDEAALTAVAPLLCVVATPRNAQADWLAAGQAMAAIYSRATSLDLGVTNIASVIDHAPSRERLAAIVKSAHRPQLLLRLGATR